MSPCPPHPPILQILRRHPYPVDSVPAASRRLGKSFPAEFGRPGRPSLRQLVSQSPPLNPADGLHLALRVMESSAKRREWAARLYNDWQQHHLRLRALFSGDSPLDWSLVSWAATRLASADGPSVQRYLRDLRRVMRFTHNLDILKYPLLQEFDSDLSELRGTHRQRLQSFLAPAEYHSLLCLPVCQELQVVVLACRRIARVGDILEVRRGGLWRPSSHEPAPPTTSPDMSPLMLECPWDKRNPSGSLRRVLIAVSPSELRILRPLIAAGPPSSPAHQRPLLFSVTTAQVSHWMANAVQKTSHSIRRGAFESAISAGLPLSSAMLLSLHKSEKSTLSYSRRPDLPSSQAMLQTSAAVM